MGADVVTAGNVVVGRGEVYFDRFNASGARTGERFLGNCSGLELTINDEVREHYSAAESTAPLVKQVNVRRTPEFAIVLHEFSIDNVALALMGTRGNFAQTGATKLNYVPPAARVKQGMWFPLEDPAGTPRRGHSSSQLSAIVVTGPSATPVYTLDTDYKVDLVGGRIYVIEGGSIADGAALEVDFTYPTISGTTIPLVDAGVDNFIEGFLRYVGKNAAGPNYEIQVWKVSISPDGAIAFIGDDFAEFRLRGRVLADTAGHPTNPHFQIQKLS